MNVIKFKAKGRRFAVPEDVMNVLRVELYKFDPQELADTMGVSRSCVYAIRSGRTKWPRGETMFRMLEALDVEIRLYAVKEGRYL